jgi:hypothetical protein
MTRALLGVTMRVRALCRYARDGTDNTLTSPPRLTSLTGWLGGAAG